MNQAAKEKFRIEEYVRWSDVDFAGLICYGSYLRFFEIAETELFRAAGLPYGEVFERFNIWLPRVQLHCDFHHPALLDDLLSVTAFIGRFGRKSLTLNFQVHRAKDSQLLAEGRFVMVAVDRKNFQSVPLPEELVASLSRFSFPLE
ncbi:MAG: thioesterase family protein [Acidobacteriota bacterium]